MTFVMLLLGFAMVGVFLPLTIYYQSVLGMSAMSAGLVIGVQSLASMITSGIVGANADRLPLKWVLFAGLLLFAVGIGYLTVVAEPDSSWWTFLPGLLCAGIGMGCAWTPLFGLATENMAPSRAGVAAGVLDTMQEFGTVLATAILGAVLANRLGAAMPGQVAAAAETLPEAAQQPFVDGMAQVVGAGAEVGAGQAASVPLAVGRAGRPRRPAPQRRPAGVRWRLHRGHEADHGRAHRADVRGRRLGAAGPRQPHGSDTCG